MKYNVIMAFLVFTSGLSAQYSFEKNDFFEIGLVTKTINKSDYLAKSTYSTSLIDLESAHDIGNAQNVMGINMKYGKALSSFAHIVFDIELAQYKTETKAALTYREKKFEIGDALYFKMLNLSFGPRFKIIGTDGFELSIEGGGKAFHTINAGDDLVAGYYGRAIAGFNLNRRVQINAKYGYEATLGKYAASNLPAELAFHVKIY